MTTRPRLALWALWTLPSVLAAQPGGSGLGEFSAYSGIRFGDGAHAAVGAAVGLMFARNGGYFIDVGFSPLGSSTVRSYPGETVRNSRLYDFSLIGHIKFPLNRKWEPYGIIGAGALYNTLEVAERNPAGPVTWRFRDDANVVFHTGAGARYFIRDGWGIRPELKVSISGSNYISLTIGFFYQSPSP